VSGSSFPPAQESSKLVVLLIRDVYPGSWISSFSIPDPGSEFFPSRISIKEFQFSNPKKLYLSIRLSEIWSGLFFPDPDPEFLPIPDPGSMGEKAPDLGSGSATLLASVGLRYFLKKRSKIYCSEDPNHFGSVPMRNGYHAVIGVETNFLLKITWINTYSLVDKEKYGIFLTFKQKTFSLLFNVRKTRNFLLYGVIVKSVFLCCPFCILLIFQ
jgi:hypothetical protein